MLLLFLWKYLFPRYIGKEKRRFLHNMGNYKELRAIFTRWDEKKNVFTLNMENSSSFSHHGYWKLCKWIAQAQRKCQGERNFVVGDKMPRGTQKPRNLCRAFSSCVHTQKFITSFLHPTPNRNFQIPQEMRSFGSFKINISLFNALGKVKSLVVHEKCSDIEKHVSLKIKASWKKFTFFVDESCRALECFVSKFECKNNDDLIFEIWW